MKIPKILERFSREEGEGCSHCPLYWSSQYSEDDFNEGCWVGDYPNEFKITVWCFMPKWLCKKKMKLEQDAYIKCENEWVSKMLREQEGKVE